MATDTKREAFIAKLEYVTDEEGKKHYIYPLKIKDLGLATELFSKINDEYVVLNMPSPLTDEQGNPILNDDDEVIIDTTAYDAQAELLELALRDTYANISEWLDIKMIQDILDAYRNLSMLKKKMAMGNKVLPGML